MSDTLDLAQALASIDESTALRIDGSGGVARTALAQGIGSAAAGRRTLVTLDDRGLLAVLDLLRDAVERRIALVARIACRDGFDALQPALDLGCPVLCARHADELIALGIVARALAEQALVPVLVAHDLDETAPCTVAPPSAEALRRAIGRPDDERPCPTAEQRALFGADARRRLPRWFDLERPVMLGAGADGRLRELARAARQAFALEPLAALADAAFQSIADALGAAVEALHTHRLENAKLVLVGAGCAADVVCEAADRLRSEHRVPAGAIGIAALSPLPVDQLLAGLRGRRQVLVVDASGAPWTVEPMLARLLGAAMRRALENTHYGTPEAGPHLCAGVPQVAWRDRDAPELFVGTTAAAGSALRVDDVVAWCRAVVAERAPRRVVLGVDLAPERSPLPKRQAVLDGLRRDRPDLVGRGVRATGEGASGTVPAPGRRPPKLVLPLARPLSGYDSLTRFWDQTGALLAAGRAVALSPDPWLAQGAMPPAAAALLPATRAADRLPALDPRTCTGCGACWTACPEGAVGPLWTSLRELIDAGIDTAKRAGRSADALRMLTGKLAAKLADALRGDDPPATFAAAAAPAFAAVLDKQAPAPDRRAALEEAFAAVVDTIGALPLVRARDIPRASGAGGGDVLTLAIDADSCTACGLCAAVCEPAAMTLVDATPAASTASRAVWRVFEELPDTAGAEVARLCDAPFPGPAAALSLSRHALLPLAAGGPATEPGSGARLAVRLALGVLEAHAQPQLQARINELDALQDELGARIRDTLAGALPTGDLDALAAGLRALGSSDVELGALAERVAAAAEGGRVDGRALDRLVATAREVADHRFALAQGAQGLGRARVGIAIQRGAATAWATAFGQNPFVQPAAVVDADAAATARGLCEGQLDAWLDDLRLARRARLELDRPKEARHAAARLRKLAFADLTDDERRAAPRFLLIVDAGQLAPVWGDLAALLHAGLPVVVLALGDADPRHGEPALRALIERDVFVVQSSVAMPDHLIAALRSALRADRPVFVHVHAPRPAADALAPDATFAAAHRALAAGAVVPFVFDPGAAGAFGTRIALAAHAPSGDVAPSAKALAAWVISEPRYAGELRAPQGSVPGATPLADWLELPVAARRGRTPTVTGDGGERVVARPLAVGLAGRLDAARVLRELAGVESPFVDRVRAELESQVAAERDARIDAAQREAETKVGAAQADVAEELAVRLRTRLVELALRGMS
ncbi:MAG: 4Fe-4S binding protein [Planctomycetes bacterium]|nr:4Fe-4S binding protein [Planctomycetota bacterium]